MKLSLLIQLLLFAVAGQCQPFNLQFGGSGEDVIYKILPAEKNQFYLLGSQYKDGGHQIWLMKTDSTGQAQWSQCYGFKDPDSREIGYNLIHLPDSTMLISGDNGKSDFDHGKEGILIKTDPSGNLIWKRYYTGIRAIQDVIRVDTGFIVAGFKSDRAALWRLDTLGHPIIKSEFSISEQTTLHKIIPAANHHFLVVGRSNRIGAGYNGGFIAKVSPDLELIWYQIFETRNRESFFQEISDGFRPPMGVHQDATGLIRIANMYESQIGFFTFDTLGNELSRKVYGQSRKEEWATSLIASTDGGWLITGVADQDSAFALKLLADGKQEWLHYYGRPNGKGFLFSAAESRNHYVLAGMISADTASISTRGWLLGVEKDGNPFPFTIHLSMHYDQNQDCEPSVENIPLSHWVITAIDSHRTTLLMTDNEGQVNYKTDATLTRFEYAAQNEKHFNLCREVSLVETSILQPEQTEHNLVIQGMNCGELEVGLTQPDLVRCDTSTFWITLVNRGTQISDSTMLRFEYDDDLFLLDLSANYTPVSGGILISIPPLAPIHGDYRIFGRVVLSCDVQLGAAHTMRAILESPNCEPDFTGARYTLTGTCTNGLIEFAMTNIGGGGENAMTTYNMYINDLPIVQHQPIILPEGGQPHLFSFPEDGRTWRMEVLPDPDDPIQRLVVATVEGCGALSTGLYNVGFSNGYSSGPPDVKTSEVVVMNSVGVPNKVAEAMPGMLVKNIISVLEPLEYTARARNATGHVVEEVIFELDFDRGLDIRTFKEISANSRVECQITHSQGLRCTMRSLNLLPGDEAMIRFRIHPYDSLMATDHGTIIRITGIAFFDGKGPVSLNSGRHSYVIDDPATYAGYGDYASDIQVYGGRGSDAATSFARSEDGSLFMVGGTNSYSDEFEYYGFVIKTGVEGKVHWQHILHIPDAQNSLSSVIPLSDGGCFVIGYLRYTKDPTYLDFSYGLIARLDAEGQMMWYKTMRPVNEQAGTTFRGGFASHDGHIIVYGYVRTQYDNALVLKLDENGDIIWQFYQSQLNTRIHLYEGLNMADGGYAFWGTLSYTYNFKPTVLKLDSSGQFSWFRTYSFDGLGLNYGSGLTGTPDNGVMVMGAGTKDTLGAYVRLPLLLRTNSFGVPLWQKELWIDEELAVNGYTIIPADGEGYFIGGSISKHVSENGDDIFVAQIDEEGQWQWYRYFGNGNEDWAVSLLHEPNDEILILGGNQIRNRFNKTQTLLLRMPAQGSTFIQPPSRSGLAHTLLFPNPVKDALHVVLSPVSMEIVSWTISDMTGKLWLRGKSAADDHFMIETSGLSPGLYIISFPESHFPAMKFIVEK